MPIDFPNNPAIGNTYPYGNSIWEWTGSSWQLYGSLLPLPTDFTSRENVFNKTQRFSEGITAQGATFHGHVLFNKQVIKWGPDSFGTTTGSIHLGSTNNQLSGPAITFGARDFNPGVSAAAGIYIDSDGSFGTRMRFGTTNSYVSGPRAAMTIREDGKVGIGTILPSSCTLEINGSFGMGVPVSQSTSFSLGATQNYVIITAGTGTVTITLPTAASSVGRQLYVKTIAINRAVVSNLSNIVQLGSATVSSTIIASSANPRWVFLVCDGTNWIIMAGNV